MGKRTKITLALLSVIIGLIFRVLSYDPQNIVPFSAVIYGEVLVHEVGHGLAMVLSGGLPSGISIGPGFYGETGWSYGYNPLILASGYLFTVLMGCILFAVNNKMKYSKILAVGIGVFSFVAYLVFASPTDYYYEKSIFAIAVYIVVMDLLALSSSKYIAWFVVNIASAMLAMAVLNEFRIVTSSNSGVLAFRNPDVLRFHNLLPVLSVEGWILVWVIVAILAFSLTFYISVLRESVES